MRITIHGPNLADQSRGDFQVHAADCRDNARVRYLFAHEAADAWTIDVDSCEAAAEALFSDIIAENEGSTAADYICEMHYCPCCASLPVDAIAEV